jgi:transcriptional regulator with XRE-family HTH domain
VSKQTGAIGFHEALAVLMAEREISGKALARKVPCDPALLSRYVNGKQEPSRRIAGLLDKALDAEGRLVALVPRRVPGRTISDVRAKELSAPLGEIAASPVLEPVIRGAARRVPNLILRRIREQERNETRSEFAEALAQTAREIGESVEPSERYIARLEDGDIRYPHPAYRRVLVELCGRSMSELGFTRSQRPGHLHHDLDEPANRLSARASQEVSAAGELMFADADISGSCVPDDEKRLIHAARKPRQHDPGVIDALSTILKGQRRLEDVTGSGPVIEPVNAQLALVKVLVTEARGDLRGGVVDIGSQWAQFSGWLHASTGRLSEANRLYGIALEWATEADNPDMLATALNMQGHVAWLGGKVGPMIGLSRAAQRDQRISPGIRALAVQQEARAMALSGEATISDLNRKFDEATALVARVAEKPEQEPPWIYFFSPDYLIMQRGLAYRLIGHYPEASELLSEGLAALPPEMRKSEWVASHYIFQLAVTHAKAGDIHQACELIKEATVTARQTGSARLRKELTRLSVRMSAKWADDPDVVEIAELLHSVP